MDGKTRICYETELGCSYDLVNNPGQRAAMLWKTERMAEKFGSVQKFQERLIQDVEMMKFDLNQKVAKWFTLVKQIEFLEMVIKGEIKFTEGEDISYVEQPTESGGPAETAV